MFFEHFAARAATNVIGANHHSTSSFALQGLAPHAVWKHYNPMVFTRRVEGQICASNLFKLPHKYQVQADLTSSLPYESTRIFRWIMRTIVLQVATRVSENAPKRSNVVVEDSVPSRSARACSSSDHVEVADASSESY